MITAYTGCCVFYSCYVSHGLVVLFPFDITLNFLNTKMRKGFNLFYSSDLKTLIPT